MSQYKVRNWSQYNESLKKRGSVNLWISEDAIKKWQAKRDPHFIGAPRQYSDDAILCKFYDRSPAGRLVIQGQCSVVKILNV